MDRVNWDPYFLGKAVRVVLFGSMLKPEVMRVSTLRCARVEIIDGLTSCQKRAVS